MRAPKNIFLTGLPGVGKTTLVHRVIGHLPRLAGGFFTRELREHGTRVGFEFELLDGRKGILAHVRSDSPYRVGKYGVEVAAFEQLAVAGLEEALSKPGAIVVDEVGRMELYSERFQSAVHRVLDSDHVVFGVLQIKCNPFLDAIRSRTDVRVIEVTLANRDRLLSSVLEAIEGARASMGTRPSVGSED